MRYVAHGLKGSCGLFGAKPMVDLAQALERFTAEGDWGLAAKIIQRLEEEFVALAAELDGRQD